LIGSRTLQALICASLLSAAATNASPAADAMPAVDIQDFRGRVVYLDFWASWCAPCRQSFPWMEAMKNAYQSRGLTVLAVNLDQNRGDADRFLAQFHPSFDVRFDPQGKVAEHFKVQGMPTGLVVDRHGVVRFTHIGFKPVDETVYENQLLEVLGEK
jgi:thiol-disulfide isomerase/thioredoxin